MIVEDAGRPAWYGIRGSLRAGHRRLCAVHGRVHRGGTLPQGGGGWADPLNYNATNGADPIGTGIAAGGGFMGIPPVPWSCSDNCSNDSEVFAFHPGGRQHVLRRRFRPLRERRTHDGADESC